MRTLPFVILGLLATLAAPAALADHGDDDVPLTCIPEDPYPCWCAHDLRRCLTHPPHVDPCRVGNEHIC